ncbi:MAG: transposase [Verrucomicrobiaceae bacterium]|nr:MAG: transposase [Verrucomicrobiaceae bacterium]
MTQSKARERRAALLREFEISRLSLAEFRRGAGLAYSTVLAWRRRAREEAAAPSPDSPGCGQWEALLVYLDYGFVEIDNNSVENAIRACALGKKNWKFIGDVGAGQRSATLHSLLGSCLRRGINPRAYLHWLFAKPPVATNRTVHTLTPAAYAALAARSDKLQASKAA